MIPLGVYEGQKNSSGYPHKFRKNKKGVNSRDKGHLQKMKVRKCKE